jgi:hypothetical protein
LAQGFVKIAQEDEMPKSVSTPVRAAALRLRATTALH